MAFKILSVSEGTARRLRWAKILDEETNTTYIIPSKILSTDVSVGDGIELLAKTARKATRNEHNITENRPTYR